MKCPVCNGEGGRYDNILWCGVGGGPYEECQFCDDDGKVSFVKLIYWYLFIIFWNEILPKFWRKLTSDRKKLL